MAPASREEIPDESGRHRSGEQDRPERWDHPEHQILQSVNVPHQAGQKIAAPEGW